MSELKAVPVDNYNGSPLVPTGNPMIDGVGPASWVARADFPDVTVHGLPKIVPMRNVAGFSLDPNDPEPRGLPVKACDGLIAGTIVDVWVDRSEPQVRYYEVELASGTRRVLLPVGYVQWPNYGFFGLDHVRVKAITAAQFADVPGIGRDDQITMLEEEKVMAYYAGGHLYALPSRSEPLL